MSKLEQHAEAEVTDVVVDDVADILDDGSAAAPSTQGECYVHA